MKLASTLSLNELQPQGKTNNTSSQKFSNLSYNYVNKLARPRLLQIKKDAEMMESAPKKFNEIWKSIRKTDLVTGGTPNINIFESIFEEHKQTFLDILKIQSAHDFFEVFDANHNGELNEDEQILILSVVKEKMQKAANELLKIQEYDRFKELMDKIRKFEKTITNSQNELRQNIYNDQLETYHEIGEDKINDFYDKYDKLFKEFHLRKNDKLQTMEKKQFDEFEKLKEKMSQPIELIKVKPNNKIKEYQNQEKLFCIVERVAEAYNVRKELKDLEVKEKELVEQKIEKKNSNHQKLLSTRHKIEMKLLMAKLEEEENKLILHLRKEFAILQKKTKIHEREIKRIQSLVTKYANFRGCFLGELKREKTRNKQQNDIIAVSKKVDSMKITYSPEIPNSGKKNKSAEKNKTKEQHQSSNVVTNSANALLRKSSIAMVKSISKINNMFYLTQNQRQMNIASLKKTVGSDNIVKFYLKQKFGEDKPVNFVMDKGKQGDTSFKLKKHEEIEKYLKEKKKNKKDIIPQLSELYDEKLSLVNKIEIIRPQTSNLEMKKRKSFLNKYLKESSP